MMDYKKVGSVFFAFFVIAALLLFLARYSRQTDTKTLCFTDSCITVEIADTDFLRQQGLMFRDKLDWDKGMLFINEKSGIHSFWMKNTLIPLDVIWIDERMQIVHIASAAPCTKDPCRTYNPGVSSKYVVEVNQGYSLKHNLSIGDKVVLPGGV
jgi:uncharacterized protein